MAEHRYEARVVWSGNRGEGTTGYRAYDRTWDLAVPGKPVLACSNDPLLGGDATKYNPEDMLIASLASCHMLWYLHLASVAGLVVQAYEDDPIGVGEVSPGGAGRFVSAVLRPKIVISGEGDLAALEAKAEAVHHQIHKVCFIARSVNFPVTYEASYQFT